MSRQKSERLYKVRGKATKRKLRKVGAKSGPPTFHKGKGFKFVVACIICGLQTGVSARSKVAICKGGHTTYVQH